MSSGVADIARDYGVPLTDWERPGDGLVITSGADGAIASRDVITSARWCVSVEGLKHAPASWLAFMDAISGKVRSVSAYCVYGTDFPGPARGLLSRIAPLRCAWFANLPLSWGIRAGSLEDLQVAALNAPPPGAVLTLGVIGGMGPAATADFLRRHAAATCAQRDQEHLPLLVHSNPALPDRSRALMTGDGAAELTQSLRSIAAALDQAGADVIVAPCNSAVPFLREVPVATIADWAQLAASALAQQCGSSRVLLLGTIGLISSGTWQQALADCGIRTEPTPDLIVQAAARAIAASKAGHPECGALFSEVHAYLARATGPVQPLIACTDLSAALPETPPGWTDASQLAAATLVRMCGGQVLQVRSLSDRAGHGVTRPESRATDNFWQSHMLHDGCDSGRGNAEQLSSPADQGV
jgi:aspartate racemase